MKKLTFTEIAGRVSASNGVVYRLIERSMLPGLSLSDYGKIDSRKILQKIDTLLKDKDPKGLELFVFNLFPERYSETETDAIVANTNVVTKKVYHETTLSLRGVWWKTEDIKAAVPTPTTRLYQLWMEPNLREMVVENGDIYKTIYEISNELAWRKISSSLNEYHLALYKFIQSVYPFEYDRYPWNVIVDIIDKSLFVDLGVIEEIQPDILCGCDDIVIAIEKIMTEALTERELSMFIERHKHGHTLAKIGNAFGISKSRCGQVIAKCGRKLRNRTYIRQIIDCIYQCSLQQNYRVYGKIKVGGRLETLRCGPDTISFLIRGNAFKDSDNKPKTDEEIIDMLLKDEPLRQILQYGVLGAVRKEPKVVVKYVKDEDEERNVVMNDDLARPLDDIDLDLSVRAWNCLVRAGLKTAGDVVALESDDLRHIRNLGQKTYEEIISRFEELGYDVAHLRNGKN